MNTTSDLGKISLRRICSESMTLIQLTNKTCPTFHGESSVDENLVSCHFQFNQVGAVLEFSVDCKRDSERASGSEGFERSPHPEFLSQGEI